ncbi:MAG: hypothetical protein ACO2OS_02315 [Thermosphaera aggregans]|jgi:hypothetical protein|uniref:hypothetical protein n=1 Tax=Thermosphaera aggregans TaxID=54254 RepID=UPI003BFBD404
MSSVVIELFDEKSIGRNFQLAALASIMSEIPEELKRRILTGITTNVIQLSNEEYATISNALASFLDVVCTEETKGTKGKQKGKPVPKLYTAGSPKDKSILASAGIIGEGDRLTCQGVKNALKTLPPDKLATNVRVPMFLKTYVFSYYRHLSETQETRVSSLLIATVGSIISLISVLRDGGRSTEIYLIPDTSPASLELSRKVYNLFYAARDGEVKKIQDLIKKVAVELGGVSEHQAILLSLLMYVAQIKELANELSADLDAIVEANGFETFLLTRIDASGNRPILISATPVSISWILKRLGEKNSIILLNALSRLISHGIESEDSDFENTAKSASAKCLNSFYRYVETGSLDTLVECSRDLVVLADKAGKLQGLEHVKKAGDAARETLYYITRILG